MSAARPTLYDAAQQAPFVPQPRPTGARIEGRPEFPGSLPAAPTFGLMGERRQPLEMGLTGQSRGGTGPEGMTGEAPPLPLNVPVTGAQAVAGGDIGVSGDFGVPPMLGPFPARPEGPAGGMPASPWGAGSDVPANWLDRARIAESLDPSVPRDLGFRVMDERARMAEAAAPPPFPAVRPEGPAAGMPADPNPLKPGQNELGRAIETLWNRLSTNQALPYSDIDPNTPMTAEQRLNEAFGPPQGLPGASGANPDAASWAAGMSQYVPNTMTAAADLERQGMLSPLGSTSLTDPAQTRPIDPTPVSTVQVSGVPQRAPGWAQRPVGQFTPPTVPSAPGPGSPPAPSGGPSWLDRAMGGIKSLGESAVEGVTAARGRAADALAPALEKTREAGQQVGAALANPVVRALTTPGPVNSAMLQPPGQQWSAFRANPASQYGPWEAIMSLRMAAEAARKSGRKQGNDAAREAIVNATINRALSTPTFDPINMSNWGGRPLSPADPNYPGY